MLHITFLLQDVTVIKVVKQQFNDPMAKTRKLHDHAISLLLSLYEGNVTQLRIGGAGAIKRYQKVEREKSYVRRSRLLTNGAE